MNEHAIPQQNMTDDSSCASRMECGLAGTDTTACSQCSARKGFSAPLQQHDSAIEKTLEHITYPLFVMSGKGGVGKSSVTVNIAAALAQKGYRVGILDVDIHGPSIPNLLGLGHGLEMDEQGKKLIPAEYLPNLHVISMDSLLKNKNTAVLWRGPKKTAAIRQFLGDVHWGNLDFLLIDSPPGTGDEHLTILKSVPNALCLVVTTPQEIALADVRKALNFLQHAQGLVLGVVENMSGLFCPHCGKSIPVFTTGGGKELARQYGIPFLGAVALDPVAAEAADHGLPVVFMEDDSAAKRDFLALAEVVTSACINGRSIRLTLAQPGSE
jgi:Mrp family chromosome partitioning ATPase